MQCIQWKWNSAFSLINYHSTVVWKTVLIIFLKYHHEGSLVYILEQITNNFSFNLFLREVAFMNIRKACIWITQKHTVVVWIYHGGGDFGKIFALLIISNIIDLY